MVLDKPEKADYIGGSKDHSTTHCLMRRNLILLVIPFFVAASSPAEWSELLQKNLQNSLPTLVERYKELHQSGELSLMEMKTASKMAAILDDLGYEVTEKVGGTGVVGVFRNGDGPTLLLRTDLDALPMQEKADVPYASTKQTEDPNGNTVGVMHSCGHDMHMTVWSGTAEMLVKLKDHWNGTLIMIGQPAEEIGQGSYNMLKDGLYERFPVPDYALALHMNPELPVGTVGLRDGYTMASVDMVDIEVYGEGGHGAAPHMTIDPVVLASMMIMEFQTIVSRNINPIESAVITVGAIHGGTKHNIIPDHVNLQLTIRTYKDEVRMQVMEGLERIGRGIAISAGLEEDKYPTMKIRENYTPANYNDPVLTSWLKTSLSKSIGEENVRDTQPVMIGEDFSRYGSTDHDVKAVMYWLGSSNSEMLKKYDAEGKKVPGLHSPYFKIDIEPAIETGVTAMTSAIIDIMSNPDALKKSE